MHQGRRAHQALRDNAERTTTILDHRVMSEHQAKPDTRAKMRDQDAMDSLDHTVHQETIRNTARALIRVKMCLPMWELSMEDITTHRPCLPILTRRRATIRRPQELHKMRATVNRTDISSE